jgi:hypothetical protein
MGAHNSKQASLIIITQDENGCKIQDVDDNFTPTRTTILDYGKRLPNITSITRLSQNDVCIQYSTMCVIVDIFKHEKTSSTNEKSFSTRLFNRSVIKFYS